MSDPFGLLSNIPKEMEKEMFRMFDVIVQI